MGGSITHPLRITKSENKFENLLEFSKKKVLQATINFQGVPTTFFELIGYDSEIMKELTGESIQKLLKRKEVMKIGEACDLRIEYPVVERKFVPDFQPINYNDCEEDMLSFKDVINQAKISKVFILSDRASSGKSVTFMDFGRKLKEHNKLFWVSFIELSKHKKLLENFKNGMNTHDVSQLLMHCIGIESELEAKIFKKLFSNGKTILLFDGIDEIIPNYTNILELVFNYLTINCDYRNQLWISTRPNMSTNFKEFLKQQNAFKFASFTKKEMENIIKDVLEVNNIYDQDKQQEITVEVMTCIDNLKSDVFCVKDVDNLFMIQSIVEYRVKKLTAIDVDSLYSVFAAIIDNQMDSSKIPPNERDNDSKLNIWDVHRAVALIKNFPNISLNSLPIVKKWKKDRKNWTSDVIQRYGFMYGNLNDTEDGKCLINFVHQSYADFFVAQFIIHFLFDDNDDMDIEEINSILSLFIRVMCNFENNKGCCRFLISYFKSHGNGKKVCDKIKQAIYDNLREVYDPTYFKRHSEDILKNFAIFMSLDTEMMTKFFKFDEYVNLLDEYVLKGWMETNPSTFIKAASDSFGPNWHEKFNKTSNKLLTHEEIEKLEREHTDIEQIKICDLYYKSEDSEAKDRFLNSFRLIPCYSGYIQVEVITRMRESLTRDRFIEKCLLKVCYKHITPEALRFIHENIEELCTTHVINRILFETYPDCSPPLLQCLDIEDPEIFKITIEFYEKHKHSSEELQDFFLLRPLYNVFLPCTKPIYSLYKEFIQKVFVTNKWQVFRQVQGHVLFKRKFDQSLKCENFEDLMIWIFSNDLKAAKTIYEKMFENLE